MMCTAKNHGIYREIIEKEFLPEVTSSKYAACHFFHPDFRRCKSMDYHLEVRTARWLGIIDSISFQALAKDHLECKFIKLNAEKAAFFVDKLKVQMLPTVVLFKDGVAEDRYAVTIVYHHSCRLIGFDGVGDGSDNVSTQDVEKRLAKAGIWSTSYHANIQVWSNCHMINSQKHAVSLVQPTRTMIRMTISESIAILL